MNVIEAIHGRRSIRAFRPDAVDRAVVEDLVWAAAQAPTPPVSADPPWTFCVVEGRERLAGYGKRALAYAREHQPSDRPWSWCDRPGFEVFWSAPVVVIICGPDGHPQAQFDCCRAGQNLVLAAYARGLGSCWVGAPLPWLRSPGVAQELRVPGGFEPWVAVILGHADESPAGHPRPRPRIAWTPATRERS